MGVDRYISRLQDITRPGNVLAELRSIPQKQDLARSSVIWTPSMYFHSLGDTLLVSPHLAQATDDPRSWTTGYQACFAKDLDAYLRGLSMNHELRPLFSKVQQTGVSAYWFDDFDLPQQLSVIYREISQTVINPWTWREA